MKKSEFGMIAGGIVLMILGVLLFSHLKHQNAVDSHTWTININGIRSFPWLTFAGFVIFMIGVVFNIASHGNKNMYSHKAE
ncbi:hypothetical protein MUY27_04250 [Mucilaginibacter sp. RS28]|uniref:Uncharacterized protein n=1 Tax=Mucilaginibacter straminoryzae TaxID=2932774 RepID=A0A9X2BAL6_9SPHI|nr:hypothetical protein [Mucilaginibacter straminoryzae]MCJ8208907.1 hypothetical protein [Mucilaginibacter straminoryzae]